MRVGCDGEAEQDPGWAWGGGGWSSGSMQRNPKVTGGYKRKQAAASLGSLFQIIGTCLPQNLSVFGCPPKLTFSLALL